MSLLETSSLFTVFLEQRQISGRITLSYILQSHVHVVQVSRK